MLDLDDKVDLIITEDFNLSKEHELIILDDCDFKLEQLFILY